MEARCLLQCHLSTLSNIFTFPGKPNRGIIFYFLEFFDKEGFKESLNLQTFGILIVKLEHLLFLRPSGKAAVC